MNMLDHTVQDLKGGVRGLLRSPGFTASALVTLALGIGATSAVFSVVKATLLSPLPYAEPERRVMLWSKWNSFEKTWLSDQEVIDYRARSRTMTSIAAWGVAQQNLTGTGEPLRVGVGTVTANTFDVLGAAPLLGRTFTASEDVPNGPPVAVLGHRIWSTHFGADPGVIGSKVLLNDVPVEILGVMRDGFRLPTDFTADAAEPTELWRPLQIDLADLQRGNHGFYGAATLAPGQTASAATAELQAITQQLTEAGGYPREMRFSAFAVPLETEIRGALRTPMWLLMGAVLFLLLIACVNVANLLLVRGDARLREMAVRNALGAGTPRLVRQLLTEGLLLAGLGTAVGLFVAAAALRLLLAVDPTSLPALAPVGLDAAVIAFTLLVAVSTTLLFGLVPALRTLRVNLVEWLREGGTQATLGGSRQRLRGALVVAQVALAIVLVAGAGLMIRSLGALGRLDLGFAPERVLTLRLAISPVRYDTPEKVVAYFQSLLDRVRAVNGVEHAGIVRVLPLATTIGDFGLDVDGYVEGPGRNAKGDWQVVSDGAFEALGTRLVRGRWITRNDTTTTQPVAVVNETMVKAYWPGGDAVGGRLRVGGGAARPWVTVVGVVADERHNGITDLVKEKFYIPHAQWHVALQGDGNLVRNVFLAVRTQGDPTALSGPIASAIRMLDPNVPIASVRTLSDVVSTATATPRLTGVLLGMFAVIALALAAVGIYGVLAYAVAQRTHEIGIRLAIGAGLAQVRNMVLKQGLTLAAIGIVTGVALALAATRLMQSLLFQVQPSDPATFAAVIAVVVGITLAASYLPALRATRVNPVTALRAQ